MRTRWAYAVVTNVTSKFRNPPAVAEEYDLGGTGGVLRKPHLHPIQAARVSLRGHELYLFYFFWTHVVITSADI